MTSAPEQTYAAEIIPPLTPPASVADTMTLEASDGHRLMAYRVVPKQPARGAIVLIQEIFGVNRHMRTVADRYGARGYSVVVPAFFDRVQRDLELPYTPDSIARGRDAVQTLGWDAPVLDLRAAITATRSLPGGDSGVAVIGYCWGGTMAWLTATRTDANWAIGYYGGKVHEFRDEAPRCPVQLHFGDKDKGIPLENVDLVRAAHPAAEIHVYPAGHGFNCAERPDFHPESAALAEQRTLGFIGGGS